MGQTTPRCHLAGIPSLVAIGIGEWHARGALWSSIGGGRRILLVSLLLLLWWWLTGNDASNNAMMVGNSTPAAGLLVRIRMVLMLMTIVRTRAIRDFGSLREVIAVIVIHIKIARRRVVMTVMMSAYHEL
jgi:hypothetical protein